MEGNPGTQAERFMNSSSETDSELRELRAEGHALRAAHVASCQEIEKLKVQVAGVAAANAHAVELMVERDEAREQLARVFEPFAQADASTTRDYGGTGLGLSISKELAGLLGGDLTAEAQLGDGCTMTLTISTGDLSHRSWIAPGPIEGRESKSVAVAIDEGSLQGYRVLLAEDSPDNQRLVSHYLRRAGAEVSIAGDGAHAVELVRDSICDACPYDCVLMDMQMPALDGYEATRKLRGSGVTLPIVALTAHAMAGARDKCLAAGCDDFLVKPIDRVALIATTRAHSQAPAAPTE